MKNLTAVSLTFLFALPQLKAEEINILFLGNSFTFRHDLKELVKEVFEEGQTGLRVNVEFTGYGGQDMFRHHDLYFSETIVRLNSISIEEVEAKMAMIQSFKDSEQAPAFYENYWNETGLRPVDWFNSNLQNSLDTALVRQQAIINRITNNNRRKWDYVVLQSWQDIVSDIDKGYGKYAQLFAQLAEEEGAKVILYLTAPHAQNEAAVSGPIQPEKTAMELNAIAQLVKKIGPYAVVPVALAINNIQEGGTDLTFRYVNDFHPNQTTAFLTANMFYAAFFKESPEGFSFNTVTETKLDVNGKDPDGGEATVVFDEEQKTYLQKAAYEAVMEFDAGCGSNAFWRGNPIETTLGFSYVESTQLGYIEVSKLPWIYVYAMDNWAYDPSPYHANNDLWVFVPN